MSERTPLVTIGASAGGIEAVGRLLAELPESLPAAVIVVVHIAPVQNRLVSVLGRSSSLPVTQAVDGAELRPGHVYVAAPDHHLLVEDGHLRVVRGPHENGHRPAIDPLFRSAAEAQQGDLVAVVLTGSLDDGAAGSAVVSRLGGHVLVQDPEEAAHPSMPLNTIAVDDPDEILPLAGIPAAITRLVSSPSRPEAERADEEPGSPVVSAFACPSCGGALWETPGEPLRFHCRIGHTFGTDSLLVQKSQQLDRALAEALRALEERAELSTRLGARLRKRGLERRATQQDALSREALRHALVIRNVLRHRNVDGGSREG
jgi:two-component system chemotaxis response regulator CheB